MFELMRNKTFRKVFVFAALVTFFFSSTPAALAETGVKVAAVEKDYYTIPKYTEQEKQERYNALVEKLKTWDGPRTQIYNGENYKIENPNGFDDIHDYNAAFSVLAVDLALIYLNAHDIKTKTTPGLLYDLDAKIFYKEHQEYCDLAIEILINYNSFKMICGLDNLSYYIKNNIDINNLSDLERADRLGPLDNFYDGDCIPALKEQSVWWTKFCYERLENIKSFRTDLAPTSQPYVDAADKAVADFIANGALPNYKPINSSTNTTPNTNTNTTPTNSKAIVTEDDINCAYDLYDLGLFLGSNDSFDLDKEPTRAEATVMLIRALGLENEAKTLPYEAPFTDVPDWAKPYINLAYKNGLVNGVSSTTFGSSSKITAEQYTTYMLRALGYKDNVDFTWNVDSKELAKEIGVMSEDTYNRIQTTGLFTRGNMANITHHTILSTQTTDGELLIDSINTPGSPSDSYPTPYQGY